MKNIIKLIAMFAIFIGITAATTTQVHAASTSRVVSTTNLTVKNYVRRSAKGSLYNLKGGSYVSFQRVHDLKNYPNTTWRVTKSRIILRNGVRTQYFFVTSWNGRASGWVWHGYLKAKPSTVTYSKVYSQARKQLGKRYVYGAVGPNSFDCSGLTKYVYKKSIKKALPRTAQSQYNKYKKVSTRSRKKGDLVFFGSSKKHISHVGIYVGSGKMIDAQNRGVITEKVASPWWHCVGYCRPATLH
ncbi:C40 family peptidase [Pediococcus cellicola]|uniref:D-alanyl-D-alanine carboxypeptidase n=1 Tax=Pediococcus cellicola TaxID=319652 RepID=A0A0R2IL23_9LACO|nr:NlpC/P60 family protein [Pediococcus cellicola]KRN65592.1 D-alanyl-D-alanine carboxypeptidase [Pediococcus cellicola]GEL15633.1 gamma-D-glutamate-meso-diaminopimelate muropeptidase [Pediococcus cellicola]